MRIFEGRLIAKDSAIRMPRKNEILVEWLDLRDKGARHRINVKYISSDKSVVREKEEIEVKMNGRRYRAVVINLLDWKRPAKRSNGKKQVKKKERQVKLKQGVN